MSFIYSVQTRSYGELLKSEDSIAAARRWAKSALPGEVLSVSRHVDSRACDRCGWSPCECRWRRARRNSEARS